MAFYSLTRRGYRLLGMLLLSSLVYLGWRRPWDHTTRPRHDTPPPVVPLAEIPEPQLPLLYEEVRAKENSLAHYEEYRHKTVKYFFDANHARSKKSRNTLP